MSSPTITPPAEQPSLTADEKRILIAFRTMDIDAKRAALAVTESWARLNPCHNRPSLLLIAGGAK